MTKDAIENRLKGKVNQAAGLSREKLGDLTGNQEMGRKGRAQRVKGDAQEALGIAQGAEGSAREAAANASEAARDAVDDVAEKAKDVAGR